MDIGGRPFLDLNEPPIEEEEDNEQLQTTLQPQVPLPLPSQQAVELLALTERWQRISNSHTFSHASSVSGFQPFVRGRELANFQDHPLQRNIERSAVSSFGSTFGTRVVDSAGNHNLASQDCTYKLPSRLIVRGEEEIAISQEMTEIKGAQIEREEGEFSDMDDADHDDGRDEVMRSTISGKGKNIGSTRNGIAKAVILNNDGMRQVNESRDSKETTSHGTNIHSGSSQGPQGRANLDIKQDDGNCSSLPVEPDSSEEKNYKGTDANIKENAADTLDSCASTNQRDIKSANSRNVSSTLTPIGRKHKIDQHKEAMLGKKRPRQTMLLSWEDVKQAAPVKTSTPRRQTPALSPIPGRGAREASRSSQAIRDQKSAESFYNDGALDSNDAKKADTNGDVNLTSQTLYRKDNSDAPAEPYPTRQNSWKQESRQNKSSQPSGRKQPVSQTREYMDPKVNNRKFPLSKKQPISNMTYQDTSVERLLREVTNEKFWHHSEEKDLQCVPGSFDSVEEYVRVFEPLLFEECRAQLYSTWEELTETISRDVHFLVRIKNIDKRDRGWYDVIVLPVHDCKWTFKEGEVAVLSSPKPGLVKPKRNSSAATIEDDLDSEIIGRVAGTVRRYSPIDTRDPTGAIVHFYDGDNQEMNRVDDDHILKKLQPGSTWYLTVLGSLATTQREYVALHAFRRLHSQMQNAILKPSPEFFPKYQEHAPALPECFTQNFVDYLHTTFNGPQLAAIQWAAMHTAAGTTTNGMAKRQDPWPFTLVQGPPGTGKTHTVWGMLNVIHLVQYQHYYMALLKKLAPESYKSANESSTEIVDTGSIDEVLQNMDKNLFRTLPKLCPKPRMLVCAPSNAATDELLARVLDRGFIDGEMKVYRPDVARVGVDTQTRAAQAVSVERRTEQLLGKGRDEIIHWMHQLRAREAQFSQQIATLQRELTAAAAAGRSQGSVGVDPDVIVARDHSRDALLQSLAAVVEGRDKVLVEMSRLFLLEGKFRPGSGFNLEEARSNLEASFANEAEIVFTTVSSSGRKLFSRLTHGFDMVVIDEAAQASEMAVLPPLSLGAARCVLVGDPQQLPATVISKAAGTLLYSRSLFERFQQAGCPTMLLSVQYRMHPQIRDFPSRYFYQGRLTDSDSVTKMMDEIYYKDPLLRPYVFYDITHGRESHRGGSVSYQNIHEAQFSLRLYEHLQRTLKSYGGSKVSVGIITPYKLQLKCLQREFEEVLSSEEGKDLYINTVDAFQGQERDVIIMSCVRASNHGVGFVADIRRMNVALTRARRALWVMGNANALVQSEDWAALIADAKERKCYTDMESVPKEFFTPKAPNHVSFPGRPSSNLRVLRAPGSRQRHLDLQFEAKSGTPSEDDEILNVNGSTRS